MFKEWISEALDILYPPKCFRCPKPLRQGSALCKECSDSLARVEFPFCDGCGEPFEGLMNDRFDCPNCKGLPMGFDFAIAALRCSREATEMVHELKYRKQVYLAKEMAKLMLERFHEDQRLADTQWLIVPVPMHWKRRVRRGFNQAEELARHFGRETGFQTVSLLKRGRGTGSQTALGRQKRMQNLKGSVVIARKLPGPAPINVLLIDDVLTTGSTARECAMVLKNHGSVQKVAVLTFMRG